MKIVISMFIIISITSVSCTPTKRCSCFNNYIQKKDITKPHEVFSKYCIKNKEERKTNDSEITFYVYDRLTGKPANLDVFVIFVRDSAGNELEKIECNNEVKCTINLSNGTYSFDISTLPNWGLDIKNVPLFNQKLEINCFLGNSLQY